MRSAGLPLGYWGMRQLDSTAGDCALRRSDGGGQHWAVVASLIETCKLNGVDPYAYLAAVISKIVNGHPNSRIDEFLPWAYPAAQPLKDVA